MASTLGWYVRVATFFLALSFATVVGGSGCSSDLAADSPPGQDASVSPEGPDGGLASESGQSSDDASVPPSSVRGTLRNPVREGTADPSILFHDGFYYLTFTHVDRITIVKARSLADLASVPEVKVWSDTTPSRCCNLWAPELQRVGDRFYIYYAADGGYSPGHRMYVLESAGNDPMGPYTFKAKLATQEFFAIDGTTLTMPDGALYFVWSANPGTTPSYQSLYIARMSNPWTLETAPVLLSQATYPFELGPANATFRVNEGPEALYHDGKTFLVYSASGCGGPDYSLGMLTYVGGDPLKQASWHKSDKPVFSREDANHVFGPGHNTFFQSPDGKETWNGYHAIHYAKGSCGGDRSLRAQRVEWRADGTPDFGLPEAATTSLALPSGDPGRMPLANGRYRITLRNTQLALATQGCAAGAGSANVELEAYGARACEQWELEALADGSTKIVSVADGHALAVPGCSLSDHGDVATQIYGGQPCESWYVDPQGAGHYRISAKHTGYPLEVDSCNLTAGTDVNTWKEYRLEPCQQWQLQALP